MRKFLQYAKRVFKPRSKKQPQDAVQEPTSNATQGAAKQVQNATPKQPVEDLKDQAQQPLQNNPVTLEQAPEPANPSLAVPTAIPISTIPTAGTSPIAPTAPTVSAISTATTLQLAFVNQTTSNTVYAYVTGLASAKNNAVFLLQSDGVTGYYPLSPASTGQPLQANCAIPLGAPGTTTTVTIPQIVGGRIWFSIDSTLTFLLNPGPALVEPSVTSPVDPNINVNWAFAEFTYNSTQIYANISYVDFVSIPVSLVLTDGTGATTMVTGMPATGFASVCAQLQAQSQSDGVAGWGNCIVQYNGKNLRALSPNNDIILRPNDFKGYWEPYVNQAWKKFSTQALTVQAENVNATGTTSTDGTQLNLSGELFNKPNTNDVFSSNSGPFTTGADNKRNQLIPQLAAALNRSTLLETDITPAAVDTFYMNTITNHYSRICHANNVDGKGYGFPYDDVAPANGADQSGYVSCANPSLLTVLVGGGQYSS
jgi:hypothetical protein